NDTTCTPTTLAQPNPRSTPPHSTASFPTRRSSDLLGTISGSAGTFTVTGLHTYAEEGTDAVSVTINDTSGGNTITATSTASVANAALATTELPAPATQGSPTPVAVTTCTEANPRSP